MNRRTFLATSSSALACWALSRTTPLAAAPPSAATGFRFGAVYFRGQNNPPREDWARDHRVAAEDGHRLFRHWVPWNVVEVREGQWAWEDYATMLDLAAANGIQVILSEFCTDFPEWLIARLPEARFETPDGRKRSSEMTGSCVSGGHLALCFNHPAVRKSAERYLRAMAGRFRGHPALLGYDIWNECTLYSPQLCCCPACQSSFRRWLQARHPQISDLARRWHRPSLSDFSQVEIPRSPKLFPEFIDSVRWRNDNAQAWMRWRRDILAATDPKALITAHGNARTHADASTCGGDDFRAAENCQVFGYTHYFGQRQSSLFSGDLIRGAAQGKPFWRAEAVGGSQWSGRKLGQPAPSMDELADPAAIRLDALTSMACGASAYMNPRWRSLLDGPLFGSYGWYADDGSRTTKSEEIKRLSLWAGQASVAPIWTMKPQAAEVALVLLEEAQDWTYAFQGDTDIYAGSVRGVHRGLSAAGLGCDFVRPESKQLAPYQVAYVPFPVAMADRTMETLLEWARQGGHLVLESCAGYFDELGHAFPQQPSRGLRSIFGPVVQQTSFALDQHDALKIQLTDGELPCSLYRQSFAPGAECRVLGRFQDGTAALIQKKHGRGVVSWIGSNPGFAMQKQLPSVSLAWLRSLLSPAQVSPLVQVEGAKPGVMLARLFSNASALALWVLNHSPELAEVTVTLGKGIVRSGPAQALRGRLLHTEDSRVKVEVGERDAAVLLWQA